MKTFGIFVGSLRKGAFTRIIGEEVKRLLPEGYEGRLIEIGHLPLYNQDFDQAGAPESYAPFREEVKALDGLIFVTPEYNRSIPGVLKNALDVASRPWGANVWDGKPALIISSSIGAVGGFGANHHLRQVLTFLNVQPVQQPELYINNVEGRVDGNRLKDEGTVALLKSGVEALISHFG